MSAEEVAMKSERTSLLPCPFCLGPAELTSVIGGDEGDGYVWHVHCAEDNDCAMMPSKYAESEDTAIQWWNTRAKGDVQERARRAAKKYLYPPHEITYRYDEEEDKLTEIIAQEFE